MGRPKKYVVNLSEEELARLKSIILKKRTSKMIRCRCEILMYADQAHGNKFTYDQISKMTGVCMTTILNTLVKYQEQGLDGALEYKRHVNSDLALERSREARSVPH